MEKPTVTKADAKKYILKTAVDRNILLRCKALEEKKLSGADKNMVSFIKSQLKDDWRTPLMKELKRIEKKY